MNYFESKKKLDEIRNYVRMAGEIAKVEHIHLLVYIQREITYDVGEGGDELYD